MKWDHYKHPYHITLCSVGGDLFSLDYICGYQYELLKGQCVYDLYSFAWTEQVRPLHASYLKTGSLAEVRPLQASLVIYLCALLGWSILIRSCLWVSICAPKGSECLWFAQFWRGWTSETTAHILLENWVTGLGETTASIPYYITVYHVGLMFSHQIISMCVSRVSFKCQCVCMVCTVLPGQNKWDHCKHLTWKLGHWLKWDHYKHPLLYICLLCWGDLFSLDHVCGYQYALLKGQSVYGLHSFGGAEQVRPLHTPYLKSGSQDEVRPLQAPLIISFCALLGVISSH